MRGAAERMMSGMRSRALRTVRPNTTNPRSRISVAISRLSGMSDTTSATRGRTPARGPIVTGGADISLQPGLAAAGHLTGCEARLQADCRAESRRTLMPLPAGGCRCPVSVASGPTWC